jgi:hypothetical protein
MTLDPEIAGVVEGEEGLVGRAGGRGAFDVEEDRGGLRGRGRGGEENREQSENGTRGCRLEAGGWRKRRRKKKTQPTTENTEHTEVGPLCLGASVVLWLHWLYHGLALSVSKVWDRKRPD